MIDRGEGVRSTAADVTLGLVVNPIAGIGGAVGLHGSDGAETVRLALALGAVPQAEDRAVAALARFGARWPHGRTPPIILAGPAEMGEAAAGRAGLAARVVGTIAAGRTTADDTRRIVATLAAAGVDLVLFAGGDGTARDVAAGCAGTGVAVLGIPAGVKVQSAVFATSAATAGEVAAAFLAVPPDRRRVQDREVVDLDEDAYRRGDVAGRIFGELPVPADERRVQARKEPTPSGEAAAIAAIAADLAGSLAPSARYVLGPGSTMRALAEGLGVPKGLLAVDVIEFDAERRCRVVAADARAVVVDALMADDRPMAIIVAPIGGQGFLFGRGNQQIGAGAIARVLSTVGRDGIVVAATPAKLAALGGRPLLVDTGDPAVDLALAGHVRVVTGFRERTVYRTRPAWEGLR